MGRTHASGPNGFFGTAETFLGTPDVVASVTRYSAGTNIGLHAHRAPYLSFVLSGSYTERIGRRTLSCQQLTVRFHPAEEEHSNAFGPVGGRCLNLELTPRWQESLDRLPSVKRGPVILWSAGALGLRVAEACLRKIDSRLQLESLIAELLGACERETRRHHAAERSPAMRRAIDFIDGELGRRFSLAEVAAQARLHPTHFARSFRALVGITVGEYVRRRRVELAESLLSAHPAATASRVAAEAGFADHAHLTRVFRKVTGTVPSAFRTALAREKALHEAARA